MFIKYQILYWNLEDSEYRIIGAEAVCVLVKALLGINNRSSTPNGLGEKGYLLTQLKNLGVYCLSITRLTCSENVIRISLF